METEQKLPKGINNVVAEMVILANILPLENKDYGSVNLSLRNYGSAKREVPGIDFEGFDKIVKNQLKHYKYEFKELEVKL